MMEKASRLAPVIFLSVAASLGMLSGCAKPTASPGDFVGTWVSVSSDGEPIAPNFATKLTLLPDGGGLQRDLPAPHTMSLRWVIRGDRLIVTERSSNTSTGYHYQFHSPDELALRTDRGEIVFRREAPAAPPDEAEKEDDGSG